MKRVCEDEGSWLVIGGGNGGMEDGFVFSLSLNLEPYEAL